MTNTTATLSPSTTTTITVRTIATDPRFTTDADAFFAELVAQLGPQDANIWWNAAADLYSDMEEGLA